MQLQTIHIDDLSRNFAMNPGEGLKVRCSKLVLVTLMNAYRSVLSRVRGHRGVGATKS